MFVASPLFGGAPVFSTLNPMKKESLKEGGHSARPLNPCWRPACLRDQGVAAKDAIDALRLIGMLLSDFLAVGQNPGNPW